MKRSRYPHWLISVASVLIVLPALAACHSQTAPANTGHLTGVVYTMGGKNAQTETAEAKLTATPSTENAGQTYTTETAKDGSFSLQLPSGTYNLTAILTTRVPGGQATPQDLTIDVGKTTSVDVFAIYP